MKTDNFFKMSPKSVLVQVLGFMFMKMSSYERSSYERYYYDVIVEGERTILSVGPAFFRIIQANRQTDKFLFEKDDNRTRLRPL